MNYPAKYNTYCPSCKKHTPHDVKVVKKGARSEASKGQRRFRRVTAGYRGYPRPFSPGAKKREKTNKKKDIRLKCTVCKKSHVRRRAFRAKKFELVKGETK